MMFQRTLGISEGLARSFEDAGYATLEDIAYVPIDEIKQVKEIPEWLLHDIRRRAREYLLREAES